ncbi:MAG: 16S rRNA (guanine(527)-N(7))-methyltransferase RsmG [Bradymonadia bacterium]
MARRSRAPSVPFDPEGFQRHLASAGLPIELTDDALSLIGQYLEMRQKWARVHNLTGPQASQDVLYRDLVDSVAVLTVLRGDQPLFDVGSGNGTPGLVLACVWSEQPITLVEPISKRSAFLRTASVKMGLKHVQVINGRWPTELSQGAQVVSRAVAPVEVWPELAVEAGAHVDSFIRMLAARRPPVNVSDFECAVGVDYRLSDGVSRRIERWDRAVKPAV